MCWELVSHIWVLTGLKAAVNLPIADSSEKEESEKTVRLECIHRDMELFSYLLQGAMLSQKIKNFRSWEQIRTASEPDFSISQISCKIKIVIERFFTLGSKSLCNPFSSLPSAELFLCHLTTSGSSSHLAHVEHRAWTPLRNREEILRTLHKRNC